jgi:hypothetical protein
MLFRKSGIIRQRSAFIFRLYSNGERRKKMTPCKPGRTVNVEFWLSVISDDKFSSSTHHPESSRWNPNPSSH